MSESVRLPRQHAVVLGVTAHAAPTGLAPTITVSSAFWLYWLDIAVEHLEAAATARAKGLEARAVGADVAPALLPETQASMVATVGAAACVESFTKRVLYLEATSGKEPLVWTAKEATNLLGTAFDVNATFLDDRLKRLFDDRNAAIHAREEDLPPEPHPLGVNSGSGHAHFTFERALEAVEMALEILEQCCGNARPGAEHASVAQMVAGIATRLNERWERVRDAERLVEASG